MAIDTIRIRAPATTSKRRPSSPRSVRTLLVANRGEIARRIFRAARKLGLQSVAVYSDADSGSVWSRQADLSVALPGSSPAATYMNGHAILEAARKVGADAVHPGYGFLAENADFAQACLEAGLVYVGPRPDAIRLLASKTEARRIAIAAGIPVVPGIDCRGRDDPSILAAAENIGFPVLVKAVAGGGGRGMRVAHSKTELAELLAPARAEALSALGDDGLLLEKHLSHARHIEVQVLADLAGRRIHLSERECSIQRRYQKLIEEAPAPDLEERLRAALTDAALAMAQAVDYTNAGTVEFLVDENGRYYFMEMNTRLQVEHGVTELLTGIDLVAWQIRIARGEPLTIRQEAVQRQRHAIECRIYAEDPARGFLPSVGRIDIYRPPAGPGVRCDDGIAAGSLVSPHYDSLLLKVLTSGYDRSEAVRLMEQALAETVILGVITNIPFLQDVLAHPAFRQGHVHTEFLAEHFARWSPPQPESEDDWLALAAFEMTARTHARAGEAMPGGLIIDPWASAGSWRNVP